MVFFRFCFSSTYALCLLLFFFFFSSFFNPFSLFPFMTKLFATRFFLLLTLLAAAFQLAGCGEDDKPSDPTPKKEYTTYAVRYAQAGMEDNADGSRAIPQFTIGVCKPDYGRPEHDFSCQTRHFFDVQDLSMTRSADEKTVELDRADFVPGQKIYFAVHYYSYYHNAPTPGAMLKAELLGDGEIIRTLVFTAEEAVQPQYLNPYCDQPQVCGGESIKIVEYTVPTK